MSTPTPRTDAFAIIASPSRNQYLDFAEQLERELTAVTEQRDAALKQTIYCNADRIAKIRTEDNLAKVTEQRDRLAEALQSVKCELGVPQPEYPAPIANAVKIADEALQSLNQDHFPDVGNMIATTTTSP